MSELGLAPLAARVLAARGVSDPVEAQKFLTPSLERDWSDPLLIPDMEEAVQRIMRAISDGESIAVFGDFDVDGMSAASVLGLGASFGIKKLCCGPEAGVSSSSARLSHVPHSGQRPIHLAVV